MNQLQTYFHFLFHRATFVLDEVSAQDLLEACQHGPFTAGGMDGWAPDDWSLLSLDVMEEFAYLLRAIEKGAVWPAGCLHGRAVFLSKTGDPSLDPIDYRILLILPVLYRKWAVVRLRNLKGWIDEWKLDCLFAGIPGLSAEDAWYETALHTEACKV